MKKIILQEDGRFAHWVVNGLPIIGDEVGVSNKIAMELSQNQQTKKYDKSTQTVINYIAPFVFGDAKNIKHGEIRVEFNYAAVLPVTDTSGTDWSGGFDSALKMDAAKRMAQMAGLTSVELFDAANVAHNLTLAEAEAVILTVGADYQTKFAQKQALMTAVVLSWRVFICARLFGVLRPKSFGTP